MKVVHVNLRPVPFFFMYKINFLMKSQLYFTKSGTNKCGIIEKNSGNTFDKNI